MESKKVKLRKTDSGEMVTRGLGWGNGEMLVKGYKLLVIRCISSVDFILCKAWC